MASAARGGHIVICGLMGGEIKLSIPVIPMRPLTIQGSYVGTVEELRELVELVKETHMSAIPVKKLPISQINSAFGDLKDGNVIGRIVLMHEN